MRGLPLQTSLSISHVPLLFVTTDVFLASTCPPSKKKDQPGLLHHKCLPDAPGDLVEGETVAEEVGGKKDGRTKGKTGNGERKRDCVCDSCSEGSENDSRQTWWKGHWWFARNHDSTLVRNDGSLEHGARSS